MHGDPGGGGRGQKQAGHRLPWGPWVNLFSSLGLSFPSQEMKGSLEFLSGYFCSLGFGIGLAPMYLPTLTLCSLLCPQGDFGEAGPAGSSVSVPGLAAALGKGQGMRCCSLPGR